MKNKRDQGLAIISGPGYQRSSGVLKGLGSRKAVKVGCEPDGCCGQFYTAARAPSSYVTEFKFRELLRGIQLEEDGDRTESRLFKVLIVACE